MKGERFGIKLVGSPRHADVLLITGPVTRQLADRVKRVYEQMPDPKYIISMGSCCYCNGEIVADEEIVRYKDKVIATNTPSWGACYSCGAI